MDAGCSGTRLGYGPGGRGLATSLGDDRAGIFRGRMLPRPTLAFLALWLSSCAPGQESPRRVILITCDTLRADRMGVYGCPWPTSPALDAFARESVVYDAAWSTAPLTGPALAALLTGRMPEELGQRDNRNVLSAEATTLAEVLAAAGIETAAIVSNWVLREREQLPGAGVQQGFAHFDDDMPSVEPNRPELKERRAADTTDAAIRWLDSPASDGSFFLWVHYQDPHGPYTPPADCLAPLERPLTDEPLLEPGEDQRGLGVLPAYQVLGDERAPEAYRIRYDAEIRYFDRELGRLLDHLRSSGLLDRSLAVFTADHGESLGEHGTYFSHGQNLHRELVRVPLLIRFPRASGRPPARSHAPVSHLDLWPTVLEAFGLDGGPCRGTSLQARELPADRVLPQSLRGGWSATSARHRLIVQGPDARLFDLERDPEELADLSPDEPELVSDLTTRWREFLARASAAPLAPAQPALDQQEERALEALGY